MPKLDIDNHSSGSNDEKTSGISVIEKLGILEKYPPVVNNNISAINSRKDLAFLILVSLL